MEDRDVRFFIENRKAVLWIQASYSSLLRGLNNFFWVHEDYSNFGSSNWGLVVGIKKYFNLKSTFGEMILDLATEMGRRLLGKDRKGAKSTEKNRSSPAQIMYFDKIPCHIIARKYYF